MEKESFSFNIFISVLFNDNWTFLDKASYLSPSFPIHSFLFLFFFFLVCLFIFVLFWDTYLGVEWLGHTEVLVLVFWETSIMCSIVATPIYSLIKSTWGPKRYMRYKKSTWDTKVQKYLLSPHFGNKENTVFWVGENIGK